MARVLTFTDELSPKQTVAATEEREPSEPWKKLGPELETLFGDIVSDVKELERFYEPARIRQWDDDFIPANLFNIAPSVVEQLLVRGKDVDLQDLLSKDSCIYLISPIGRGKTTYIHHKLKVDLPQRFKRFRLIPIIFDVQKCTQATEFVPLFVRQIDDEIDQAFSFFSLDNDEKASTVVHKALCEAFSQQLRKAGLEATYVQREQYPDLHRRQREELSRLRKESPIDFNATRLAYARSKDRSVLVVLVVDNIDQHLMFEGGEEIIKDSHAIAKRLECPLIMTLRDTSFRKNNPAFLSSSYSPRYLALSAGSAQQMLGRRLMEAPSMVKEDKTMARFIEVIANQLGLSDPKRVNRMSGLIEAWVEPISNKNRREMLDVMKSVISSLHLTSTTFERNRPSKNDYINTDFEIAIAKVKMAILLGRHPYYADDSYRVCALNLFREDMGDIVDRNLIRLKLLQYLYHRREEGVIVHNIVEKCLAALGESARWTVRKAVIKLLGKGLAVALTESGDLKAALQRLPIDLDKLMNDRLHITLNGAFHLDVLLKDDIYLDEMKYGTPLPEKIYEQVFKYYKEGWPNNRDLRHESTLAFIQHLITCEKEEVTKRLSDVLGVADIMHTSSEAYWRVIRAMDEHDSQRLGRES